jgi:hypothetical protein
MRMLGSKCGIPVCETSPEAIAIKRAHSYHSLNQAGDFSVDWATSTFEHSKIGQHPLPSFPPHFTFLGWQLLEGEKVSENEGFIAPVTKSAARPH